MIKSYHACTISAWAKEKFFDLIVTLRTVQPPAAHQRALHTSAPILCCLEGSSLCFCLGGYGLLVFSTIQGNTHYLCLDILSLWFCLFFKKKPCHTHLVTSRYAESNALKHIFRPNLFNPEFCLRDITLPLITVGS